jgi:urease accessory protein
MLTLTRRSPADSNASIQFTLLLTAEDRTRSRHYFETVEGQGVYLRLPRGTVLRHGDLLESEVGDCRVRVLAKPEPVLTVTAYTPLELLRAAYHLGNRHVPLEVTANYLRLSPDPVLQSMVEQLGLHVRLETAPFEPEAGAYSQSADSSSHSHSHSHSVSYTSTSHSESHSSSHAHPH